ncbi:hypothetical protein Q4534_02350 [Cyclobacterium sp. 1_MG-2023]|uniref:hypothetical protein n=1 Tax=Cyclobacterium sp. 1_MG-2023 TaxID=3062681 RepID=UPI0026E3B7DE|nr:hypothetical protein [Cyclobacterium sp. 1_MG-2023]MDO6436226.1 hypothetical protein [Cyclobacterium sp. 1_MG-2023]
MSIEPKIEDYFEINNNNNEYRYKDNNKYNNKSKTVFEKIPEGGYFGLTMPVISVKPCH